MSSDFDQRVHELLHGAADALPPYPGLATRIEEATMGTTVGPQPDTTLIPRRPRRWLRPLLAAAAVAAVVVGIAVAVTVGPSHRPPTATLTPTQSVSATAPTPTPSTVTSSAPRPTPTAAALLPQGTEAARSAIPWDQVGIGWTVALWTPDAPVDKSSTNVPGTVYLVNPVGGRYRITDLDVTSLRLADVSGDHHRAVFTRPAPSATDVIVLDLQTGQHTQFRLNNIVDVEFTQPNGLALLAFQQSTGVQNGHPVDPVVYRVTLTGQRQYTYSSAWYADGDPVLPLYTPDGTELVFSAASGLTVVGNNGADPRTVALPHGVKGCIPTRWWAPNVVLTSCLADTWQLWLVPIDGRAPTALRAEPADAVSDFGDFVAWPVGNRTYVGGAVNCGSGFYLRRLESNGTTSDVQLPIAGFTTGSSIFVSGATSSDIYVYMNGGTGCGNPARQNGLYRYNPAGNTASLLLGSTLNHGTVLAAVTYDVDR